MRSSLMTTAMSVRGGRLQARERKLRALLRHDDEFGVIRTDGREVGKFFADRKAAGGGLRGP